MKRVRIPSASRPALFAYGKELYRRAGGKYDFDKRHVNTVVGFFLGEPIGKRAAWLWLHDHFVPPGGRLAPSGDFYISPEWRTARFEALKLSDGKCCLCGRSKRHHGVVLHVDHIKPRSKYPSLALKPSNLQVLCEDCNLGKSNRDDTDWRPAANRA